VVGGPGHRGAVPRRARRLPRPGPLALRLLPPGRRVALQPRGRRHLGARLERPGPSAPLLAPRVGLGARGSLPAAGARDRGRPRRLDSLPPARPRRRQARSGALHSGAPAPRASRRPPAPAPGHARQRGRAGRRRGRRHRRGSRAPRPGRLAGRARLEPVGRGPGAAAARALLRAPAGRPRPLLRRRAPAGRSGAALPHAPRGGWSRRLAPVLAGAARSGLRRGARLRHHQGGHAAPAGGGPVARQAQGAQPVHAGGAAPGGPRLPRAVRGPGPGPGGAGLGAPASDAPARPDRGPRVPLRRGARAPRRSQGRLRHGRRRGRGRARTRPAPTSAWATP
jgi:hypothetical protein